MYEAPSMTDVSEVVIDEKVITDKAEPKFVKKKAKNPDSKKAGNN